MTTLSHLTTDELADGICLRAGRIAAAQAELLTWIAEFDRRDGWAGPGMLSCAYWLSWRIGLSLGAARDQVRVARRLEDLPDVAAAFADGRISYSKVRAITRAAEPGDDVDWVRLARHSSAAQLELVVRGVARARREETARTDPEAVPLQTRVTYDRDGNFVMTISGPAQYLPVLRAGLEAKRGELARAAADGVPPPPAGDQMALVDGPVSDAVGLEGEQAESAEPPTRSRPTDADALLALAQDALAAERAGHPDVARRRRAELTAQVDPLSGWARQTDGELLPPTSLRTVMRTLPGRDGVLRLRPVTGADLTRHDLGRGQREVSTALRTLLGTLDGERCRFPGCTRHRKLHAHHVVFWSRGGSTDLSNLVLVCARHHTLIHSQGFRLVLRPDRRLEVRTADGVPVLHHPAQPWGDPADLATGCGQLVSAETLPPTHCRPRMDLRYVVSVVLRQSA